MRHTAPCASLIPSSNDQARSRSSAVSLRRVWVFAAALAAAIARAIESDMVAIGAWLARLRLLRQWRPRPASSSLLGGDLQLRKSTLQEQRITRRQRVRDRTAEQQGPESAARLERQRKRIAK